MKSLEAVKNVDELYEYVINELNSILMSYHARSQSLRELSHVHSKIPADDIDNTPQEKERVVGILVPIIQEGVVQLTEQNRSYFNLMKLLDELANQAYLEIGAPKGFLPMVSHLFLSGLPKEINPLEPFRDQIRAKVVELAPDYDSKPNP